MQLPVAQATPERPFVLGLAALLCCGQSQALIVGRDAESKAAEMNEEAARVADLISSREDTGKQLP